jgi:endonuclease/exonuclease/phosphatase family metal-dependent hydrolase
VTALRRILWTLGWGGAGLLVLAFLLGYAAPYLPPARFWWTDLLAVLLLPLSGAVGAVALGLGGQGLYRRRWGRVAFAASLLLLIVLRFGPRLTAWSPVTPALDDLRVMTLNVPSSFGPVPNVPLADLVTQKRPDVLAVQESRIRTGPAASRPALRHVSPSIQLLLSDSVGYAPPRGLPPNTEIQQPVLGRAPLDSLNVHPLPPRGDTDARSRYTRTQFTWQGRPAVLYNVHLHTVGQPRPWETVKEAPLSPKHWRTFLRTYREGTLRRAQQARLIRRAIEREERPVIVVGDFNSTPHQWAYRHIAQGLQSAATRRIRGWTATFPAERPLVRIDHVLASPAWQIVTAHVPSPPGTALVSDHRPVLAQLRWKDPALD